MIRTSPRRPGMNKKTRVTFLCNLTAYESQNIISKLIFKSTCKCSAKLSINCVGFLTYKQFIDKSLLDKLNKIIN